MTCVPPRKDAAQDGDMACHASAAERPAAATGRTVPVVEETAPGTIVSDQEIVPIPPAGEVTFGRGQRTDGLHLRIGHAPVHDTAVPRLAGRVFAWDGRIVVANMDDTLALDVRVHGRPAISLSPGDWHAPCDSAYRIVVTGTYQYSLGVTVNSDERRMQLTADGRRVVLGSPTGVRPEFTARQRRILDAYVAPLTEGGTEPASHAQVAEAIGVSRSLVRLECNMIYSQLLRAGVPMRDLDDTRDQIADAWARHRF
jgi:hypothetical protein